MPSQSLAQSKSNEPDIIIDAATRTQVIEGTLNRLNDSYVFPKIARQMEAAVRQRLQRREYDQITSAAALAETLTKHLQEISRDKHLHVLFNYEPRPLSVTRSAPSAEQLRDFRRAALIQSSSINHGFKRVERLDGNIGYLRVDLFVDPEFGGDTAAAALGFVSNTHALIIDIRNCNGGVPEMVALLSTYLFEDAPVHLSDIYDRPTNQTQQFWTLPYVPGKRYAGRDVYVLTSKRTASAAEEFAYDLQQLKRATIIGETTIGAANPGGTVRVNEHFQVFIPTGRAINPISKTNWEGFGVKPDVEVSEEQALKAAQIAALKKLIETGKEEGWKGRWIMLLETLQKQP
ncbi:MAG: S41 family peptidase [Acidobacteria bacterium]|nr:S41 family peptidase [Acidobacteriota bacterium]